MAPPPKWGSEFIVNSAVSGDQESPSITSLANGGFVAVWMDSPNAGASFIYAQIFNADGSKVGAELLVDTTTDFHQIEPAAAALPNGGFVVTWADNPYNSQFDIAGQVFNFDGTKSGGVFHTYIPTIFDDREPVITALSDEHFVIAWNANGEVDAQIFKPDGASSTGRFAATLDLSFQAEPAIAALSGGRFVMAWTEQFLPIDHDIHAQIFKADGSTSGGALVVQNASTDDTEPSITALATGGFVVAWTEFAGGVSDIRAQRFDDNGMKVGASFVITSAANTQHQSALAALPDGRFVAAWVDDSQTGGDTSYAAIRAQVFNPNGAQSSAEFLVNSTTLKDQDHPAITVLADGRFIVGWTNHSGDGTPQLTDVRAQIFDPREKAVNLHGTALNDDWVGSQFDDTMKGGGGADRLAGAEGKDILSGGDGDDTLIGGLGDDTLEGGAGDDTALYSQSLDQYVAVDIGSAIIVGAPEGYDRLSGIEHLQFTDGTITPNDGNPLFDTVRYMNQNLDVFHAGADALAHFNTFGWHEGRDPNAYFSVNGYLDVNPDVKAMNVNPLEHYHQTGWHEGRDPSAWFDTKLYLIHNPDVAAMGVDPLEHFLQHGISEGREAYAAIGPSIVNGFDAQYYLMNNRDVAAAGVDPLQHYQMFGWHEGRSPNGWFDSAGYLAHYADVAAAGVNPLEHYLQFGWKEGRDPSAAFDTLGYLVANPDVAAAGVNPLEHFLTFGAYEGRAAVNDGVWH